ncbi:MAG: hypothetical protein ACE5GH_07550 [Fidelibacterota bacterium]
MKQRIDSAIQWEIHHPRTVPAFLALLTGLFTLFAARRDRNAESWSRL